MPIDSKHPWRCAQADIALELMDVESNVAILNMSPPDKDNDSLTLATYRCQDSTNRVEMKMKVQEVRGQSDGLGG